MSGFEIKPDMLVRRGFNRIILGIALQSRALKANVFSTEDDTGARFLSDAI